LPEAPPVLVVAVEHKRETPLVAASPFRAASTTGLMQAAEKIFLGMIPLVVFGVLAVVGGIHQRHFGFDFKPVWEAARHLFHGASPYPPPHEWALRDEHQYVYPPLTALLSAPFAVFPFLIAASLYAAMLLGATALTLRLLGVRDWRCYGVALLWYPVIESVTLVTVSSLLALGLAVAWRYRDRRWVAAVAVAGIVAGKVFLWPLLIWLAATRRGLVAARALILGIAATTVSWALIGFAGLTSYPQLLNALANVEQRKSYSTVALGLALGLPAGEARAVGLAAGAVALLGIVLLARAHNEDADRHAFIAAIAAAFLFTPIVWSHYLCLLIVPIAISRPRLTPLWFVPLAIWATPGQHDGKMWQVAIGFSVWLFVLAASLRRDWRLPAWRRVSARPPAPAET
jgi:alpha-1,2-mannosyltransferase